MSLPPLDQAWSLLRQERYPEALVLASKARFDHPDNVSAIACHSLALWNAERDLEGSRSGMLRAVGMNPGDAALRQNFAFMLSEQGDVVGAAQNFEEVLRLSPGNVQSFWGLTGVTKFEEETDLVRSMIGLYDRGPLDPRNRELLAFALAKIFDELGSPERAMGYAQEANRLGARPWDAGHAKRLVEDLASLTQSDAFRAGRGGGHPTRAPLFIVGPLRSGTTLVETILSRHPAVLALGESMQIPEVEAGARQALGLGREATGLPSVAAGLKRDWLKVKAEAMVKSWVSQARGRPFELVTDKLPDNALLLGLIARLFPRARIIHMRRHPLDSGLSNYMQHYGSGQGFSSRLDWSGLRIRQIADSMALWKRSLDLEFLDVSYERLVADPEPEIRRLTAFAGLEWTDAFLRPQDASRAVFTASKWQVRQPIYKSSVSRWKLYEPWLGPMIEAMGGFDWIDREVRSNTG